MIKTNKHAYVVCAYKESPYLSQCIESLKMQSIDSGITVVTSTPNLHIEEVCRYHDVPLVINEGQGGIAQDWNFGYKNGDAEYVTIAHQDDVYANDYTEEILKRVSGAKNTLIAFSDYGELRNNEKVEKSLLLNIKGVMLLPLRIPGMRRFKFIKRMVVAFGNPICCPAVTYHKSKLPEVPFKVNFRSNVDWELWEVLSKREGTFEYIPKVLMYHRIHEGSETSAIIGDSQRGNEDFEMFSKFWPNPIARLLTKIYGNSEKSNQL